MMMAPPTPPMTPPTIAPVCELEVALGSAWAGSVAVVTLVTIWVEVNAWPCASVDLRNERKI